MAMGRNFRVFHNAPLPGQPPPAAPRPYSLVLEQRGREQEVVLVENYAITTLAPSDFEGLRKQYTKHIDAHGCLGILRVNEGEHVLYFLVLVTGCSSAGKIGTSEVYRVSNVSMVSMRGHPHDEEKVAEIKKLLCCGAFYFSWSSSERPIDLTLAAQKAARAGKRSDNRFFWNRMFHIPFLRHGIDCDAWLLKVMCGSVEVRTVYVGSKQAKAAVVSRLSVERAGTRFQVRGVDDQGHVANFAETEQAIFLGDEVTSFVQIRGSVPLFWDQPGINVGSHKIRMSRGPEFSAAAFDLHVRQLKENYGHQAIVNLLGSSLVGSKEGEATLSTAYQTHHKACDHHLDVPHILFDYHAEVKSGSAKKLETLRHKVHNYVDKFGFFTRKGAAVSREQFGTVRTNCTDCLDRTNAVQTYLGQEVLGYQLLDLGLNDKPNVVSRFHEMFKQMWINNGNELSKMYAGTGALGGAGGSKLIDGARSAARTIQNNLLDATKQEAIDVILFGSSFNSDLADRARVLLPPKFINAPKPLLDSLVRKYLDYTEPVPLRVAVGTYNINGGKHFRSIVYKDVSLSDWLLDAHKAEQSALIDLSSEESKSIDVYAIGFEEMVDLDAKNIVNASSENAKAWAQELTRILNRDEKFSLLTYQQLVGVCLYVFVRPELAPHIRDVAVDSVKTGMGGATGNKGAVAIRMRHHSTSLCFVCSHFAAGQNNITDRNNDFAEAVKKITFPKGRNLLSHDYVFWCGDFNYRINMGREDVKGLVAARDWDTLLSADQLKIEYGAGNVFQGFQEGPISFAPTYKYDLFSEDYDTSEKLRVPAWTDRVMWRRRQLHRTPPPGWSPGTCRWYGRAELKQSDHRPVLCILDVEVLRVDEARREGLFEDAMRVVGPPDGSVLLQFKNAVSFDIQSVIDDHFMQSLVDRLEQIGKIRFTKYINEMIWVAFMDHSKALEAEKTGVIEVCGHEMTVALKHPNWRELLSVELDLCSNSSHPLCGASKRDFNMRKESARLFSQLSQLSFEELEDITMPDTAEVVEERPEKPPPPARPAPPPARPSAPPSRPSAPPARPPARPAPPPSRPAPPALAAAAAAAADEESPQESPPPPRKPPPPKPQPAAEAAPAPPKSEARKEESSDSSEKGSAGFSDIFAVTSPNVECDLPISSSSGSIVALGGGAPDAPKEPPPGEEEEEPPAQDTPASGLTRSSSSSHSLSYPDNYDPLVESGKAWVNGTEQVIPGQEAAAAGAAAADPAPPQPPDELPLDESSPPPAAPAAPPPSRAPPPTVPPRQPSQDSGGGGKGSVTPTSSSSGAGTPKKEGAAGVKLAPKRGAAPPPPPPARQPPSVPSRPPPVPKR